MTDFKLTTRKGVSRINLGDVLDITAAASLKAVLLKALDKGQPLVLDAGSVERLSTPCIQILLAGATALQTADLAFTLLRPSDAFIDSLNELGLFPILKQWDIEA